MRYQFKKNNIVIATYFVIVLAILGIIKCDSMVIKKHLQECIEKCKPEKSIESLSRSKCVCDKKGNAYF